VIVCRSTTNFTLRADLFDGDRTGSVHVGPGQVAVVQHTEDLELMVNMYVYEGGKLVLPSNFICFDINIFLWYVYYGGNEIQCHCVTNVFH